MLFTIRTIIKLLYIKTMEKIKTVINLKTFYMIALLITAFFAGATFFSVPNVSKDFEISNLKTQLEELREKSNAEFDLLTGKSARELAELEAKKSKEIEELNAINQSKLDALQLDFNAKSKQLDDIKVILGVNETNKQIEDLKLQIVELKK
jgi:hypothetical protein